MSERVRFDRLLGRGYYPIELPPVFRTEGFSFGARKVLDQTSAAEKKKFFSQLITFEGPTFQGTLRKFGIINPISFSFLSQHIASNWAGITETYSLSNSSGTRPKFGREKDAGRAITASSVATNRARLERLASTYPTILSLDISRFYGSIYTHSIPWAVLGKSEAKRLYTAKKLNGSWPDTLDLFVRNCNARQTIGLPIGPDTSRIISELILSRLDRDMIDRGVLTSNKSFIHNIDDYQFGVFFSHEAEEVQASFVGAIKSFELDLNDFKTRVDGGVTFSPKHWQREFDIVKDLSGVVALEVFFDKLYSLLQIHKNSNVVGYALKRFARQLASNSERERVAEFLQRLLFAAPYHARWVFPILLENRRLAGASAEFKRLLFWGIETSARRGDVGSTLWFLYAFLYLNIKIPPEAADLAVMLNSPLSDIMLMHARSRGLVASLNRRLSQRYKESSFDGGAWLFLYETELKDWRDGMMLPSTTGGGTAANYFSRLIKDGTSFYSPDRAENPSSFDGWALTAEHFVEQSDEQEWGGFLQANFQQFTEVYD